MSLKKAIKRRLKQQRNANFVDLIGHTPVDKLAVLRGERNVINVFKRTILLVVV